MFSFLIKTHILHNFLAFLDSLLPHTWVGMECLHGYHWSDSQGPLKWSVFQNTWLLLGTGEINGKCLQNVRALTLWSFITQFPLVLTSLSLQDNEPTLLLWILTFSVGSLHSSRHGQLSSRRGSQQQRLCLIIIVGSLCNVQLLRLIYNSNTSSAPCIRSPVNWTKVRKWQRCSWPKAH